jgi:hypothetical protein
MYLISIWGDEDSLRFFHEVLPDIIQIISAILPRRFGILNICFSNAGTSEVVIEDFLFFFFWQFFHLQNRITFQ